MANVCEVYKVLKDLSHIKSKNRLLTFRTLGILTLWTLRR